MSEKPTGLEHYTQDALWADDIHAVIAGLGLRKPIFGGWSYGGFIINDYLAKYGQDAVGGINYVGAAVLIGIEKAANMFGSGFTDNAAGLCSDNLDEDIRALRSLLRAVFEKQPSQRILKSWWPLAWWCHLPYAWVSCHGRVTAITL